MGRSGEKSRKSFCSPTFLHNRQSISTGKMGCYSGEEYENKNACPVCGALRYKIRRNDPGDVEGEPPRKKVPAKVMWYAPIIPRLKCLFRNKEHTKLLL